jgi:hypothetical protein
MYSVSYSEYRFEYERKETLSLLYVSVDILAMFM